MIYSSKVLAQKTDVLSNTRPVVPWMDSMEMQCIAVHYCDHVEHSRSWPVDTVAANKLGKGTQTTYKSWEIDISIVVRMWISSIQQKWQRHSPENRCWMWLFVMVESV